MQNQRQRERAMKNIMAGHVGVRWTRRFLNICTREGKIPEELRAG